MAQAEAAPQQEGLLEDEEELFREEEEGLQPTARAASGKFPCLKCKKNGAKGSVRCNTCYMLVHIKCQKITKEV